MTEWSPQSWQKKKALQQPDYAPAESLRAVLKAIGGYPPLVVPGEVEKLRQNLAMAARENAFVLQAGNCAETFGDCQPEVIMNQLKILLQMSVILTYGVRKNIVRIGRIAGQYAKPRSSKMEETAAGPLPSYRGDSVNSAAATAEARRADPARLLSSYHHAAMTLNYVRALIDGGFADLHHPQNWKLHSIEKSRNWKQYRTVVERILDAIHFMESFGGARTQALGRIDYYTSHEGLLLGYEEALTRRDEETGRFYNLGAHMLWIGNRTRALDGAHVEYFRGLANPIGAKIGPKADPEEIAELAQRLNPEKEEGRLTFITRLGAENVRETLPALIHAVQKAGVPVLWSCDPMHGNTRVLENGVKTRDFVTVLEEIRQAFLVHQETGSHLSGVHFELTGEDVTECIGGGDEAASSDLSPRYETLCDPRLNYSQSLEMAFMIATLLKKDVAL